MLEGVMKVQHSVKLFKYKILMRILNVHNTRSEKTVEELKKSNQIMSNQITEIQNRTEQF